ncbi:hypothetical protein H072_10574 [Dactylellina haptotyla CBS 200.50]|uniref:Uncharacterized protein n=1 Tax=Dactylellina haptotyla (strain CBS 200.50) TaxID=1284197 RepID=S8BL29_DACHA|nr:hypothetical protein H072_10574 [Dactylellina haptotyla CBS 200.50]
MQISMNTAAAAAILLFTSQVSGHAAFTTVIGDADQKIIGNALGYNATLPRDGNNQMPFQDDTTVFNNPIVPATEGSLWHGKPRMWWSSGCGSSIGTLNKFYETDRAYKYSTPKMNADQRNKQYYQYPARALIEWRKLTYEMAKGKRLPKATANGWLRITVHQITPSGAGPYKCRIDSMGSASIWGEWLKIPDENNVPGSVEDKSINPGGILQDFPLTVPIPADLKCTGVYGEARNVCMMRCENFAADGPFGGCVPFILEEGDKAKSEPPAVELNANLGTDSEKATKVKRDEFDDIVKDSMGDFDNLDPQASSIAKAKFQKIPADKLAKIKEKLEKAKQENEKKAGQS